MEGTLTIRLSKAAREFNIGIQTIIDFLAKKGISVENNPNAKLTPDMYALLMKEFQHEKSVKEEAMKIGLDYTHHETISIEDKKTSAKIPEKEKESEDLLIKTSFGFADDIKAKKTKAPEKPRTEPAPAREPAAPAPAEPAKETRKVKKEPAAPAPAEKTAAKKEEPAPAAPPEHPEPAGAVPETVKKEAEEAPSAPTLKILGKIDLESLEKPKTAKKDKRKKEEAEVAEKEAIKVEKPDQAPEKHPVRKAEEPSTDKVEEAAATPDVKTPAAVAEAAPPAEETYPADFIKTQYKKLEGPVILGKIDLSEFKPPEKKPVASSSEEKIKAKKKKRKRIKKGPETETGTTKTEFDKFKTRAKEKKGFHEIRKPDLSDEDIQKQIKETLARLSSTGKSKAAKYRRQKRDIASQHLQEEQLKLEEEKSTIKVTEFVTANELATMMQVPVTEVISTCMSLGLFVSINQRLDAETLSLVAEEFGYKIEFVSVEVQEAILHQEEPDHPDDLVDRTPIVTVMGHVDHGKTSLLDYIRNTNVIAGEAGGITQHIGAYEVTLDNGKKITFLDTPGHEAFTAMRARGAKVTDVAIIVIAADDNVMPQTVEAINHAQAAGVPIVFAINKMDKANANPEKIKEELSKLNILVEDWGGKYQSQEISAKAGTNVDQLLEKVLLEAEMLDLKANPDKPANGTVLESSLDKGRGYVAKLLVQNGTMKNGDIVLAGTCYGRVKAMYNERNVMIKRAGPSSPVLLLGLNGAPQAGDLFNVMSDEKETKNIATKRQQLQREQGIRTQKHITLDEIGRRIAIGDFKELNIIVKGDVDGSVEALSDALLRLSTVEVQVNVIHKSVGQITESDVLLASASNAIIVGFQVRPSLKARKLAENEQIDIRLYSIIYTALNEIKSAIEGMLSPDIEEKILCNIEVREVYKITKVGTVAGCFVLDGKINRNNRIRLIRDGIVVHTGTLASLKRFKDDVKEVQTGYECGLNIENFNDIKVGDIIEGYEEIEVKRKL